VCELELAELKENWGDWDRSREPPERRFAESKESIARFSLRLSRLSLPRALA